MAMAVELLYRYARPSTVGDDGVALATDGLLDPTVFFDGFVESPDQAAVALLTVARVARTRFYETPNVIAARIAAADPVVTSGPTALRFESFSACAGVHARFDALPEGLDTRRSAPGTVNVDFNPPMREALARVAGSQPLRMKVGFDAVEVETFDGAVQERRVPLPERWFKGFSEVQVAAARMEPVAEVRGVETMRFLRGLPRGAGGRSTLWAVPSGKGLRLAARATPRALAVAAPERLRVLEPVARFVKALRGYGAPGEEAATTWVAELAGARLTVTLSPALSRGFSGEGGLLHDLADETLGIEAEFLDASLAGRWTLTDDDLRATGMTAERARRALSWLGAHGRLGFDVVEGTYFRRELPFPPAALTADPPRLRDARKLQAQGAVRLVDEHAAHVESGGATYEVREGGRCTCPWWARHAGDRGPCKHVLAVALERAHHARPPMRAGSTVA
jgi:hypothetical protein